MPIKKSWDTLKVGSIILTIWGMLNALVGLGCVVYLVVLNKNAPGFLMLFKPSEIALLDPKVLATTNAIAIIANTCITAYSVAVLFIIRKALMNYQRWAFWCLATTIIFTQIAGYFSDALLGNTNIVANNISTMMIIFGLGLSAHGIFKHYAINSVRKGEQMVKQVNLELIGIKKEMLNDMVSYMKYGGAADENDPNYDPEFDSGYRQKHVERCEKIVDQFLTSLATGKVAAGNKDWILKLVKKTVLNLNKLNEECDGSLIETDQRERLCELIITASRQAGLVTEIDDITEEWREW